MCSGVEARGVGGAGGRGGRGGRIAKGAGKAGEHAGDVIGAGSDIAGFIPGAGA